ncbi:MAG: TetR/AcrR family transcriptional regulator [Thermodesulfovibrionales bacterium]
MGSQTKLDRETRRAQIVAASLGILGRKGVTALTTSAIAREAGISEANIYRHFEDKDEILHAMADEIRAGLERNLARVPGASPLAGLRRVYRLHLEYIEKNEGIPRLLFSEQLHSGRGGLREKLLESINAYAGRLAGFIRRGQEAGLIREEVDPRASALTLIGMVQATTLRWSLSGFSFSLVEEGMKLWKNFERCVSPR